MIRHTSTRPSKSRRLQPRSCIQRAHRRVQAYSRLLRRDRPSVRRGAGAPGPRAQHAGLHLQLRGQTRVQQVPRGRRLSVAVALASPLCVAEARGCAVPCALQCVGQPGQLRVQLPTKPPEIRVCVRATVHAWAEGAHELQAPNVLAPVRVSHSLRVRVHVHRARVQRTRALACVRRRRSVRLCTCSQCLTGLRKAEVPAQDMPARSTTGTDTQMPDNSMGSCKQGGAAKGTSLHGAGHSLAVDRTCCCALGTLRPL